MIFLALLWTMSAAGLALAGACALLPRHQEWYSTCEAIPRNRTAGGIIGGVALLWLVPNIRPIVTEGGLLSQSLVLLAVAALVLSWIYLDYLLARALGGFLILAAHYFLKESYALELGGQIFYALIWLLWGTLGICICAKPHWMRDAIRAVFRNRGVQWGMAGLGLAGCAACAAAAIQAASAGAGKVW